jgi:serine/threonine protein kinase
MNKHSVGLIVSVAAGTAPWIFGANQISSSDETNVKYDETNIKYVEELILHRQIQNPTAKDTIAREDNPVVENLIDRAMRDDKAKTALEAFCDTGKLPANIAPQPPSSGTKIPLSDPGWLEKLVKNGQHEFILKTIAGNKQLLDKTARILAHQFDRSAIDWCRAPEVHRAPEILINDKQCIQASDILAFGVVLYQRLANLLLESMFPPPRKESNPLQVVQELINNNNTSSSTALCSQRNQKLIRTARQLLDTRCPSRCTRRTHRRGEHQSSWSTTVRANFSANARTSARTPKTSVS